MRVGTWYLVEDASDLPAHHGALAALLADALGAMLWCVPTALDETRFPDAVQYVTRDRGLAPSGLIWAERLGIPCASHAAASTDALSAAAGTRDIVVPLHPQAIGDDATADAWRARAAAHGVTARHCRVLREAVEAVEAGTTGETATACEAAKACEAAAAGDMGMAGPPDAGHAAESVARIVDLATGRDVPAWGRYAQDRFGRWSTVPVESARERARGRPVSGPRLCIALIGAEANQRDVYPATLAALGDALDAARVDEAALELRFVAPDTLHASNVAAALAGCDGIVLPGGADMRAVPGQIIAARHGWLSRTPVVGLCLGMQTMATAVLQEALGATDVGLAEVDANVRVPSFVPMRRMPLSSSYPSSPSLPSLPLPHRVGEHRMRVVGGACLEKMLDGRHRVRYNHRYRLNPALCPALTAAGVSIAARDAGGEIVDAIEARDHPFFIGMQGHPEQSSARGRPHPLLRAFVDAARAAASR